MLLLLVPLFLRLAAAVTVDIGDAPLMEFDLVFPRNETYAPTQFFPLVLAVKNSTATWPAGLSLSITIWPHTEEVPPPGSRFNFPSAGRTSGAPPSTPNYFAIAGSNLTNGTVGHFSVVWSVSMHHTCTDIDPFKLPGERLYTSGEFNIHFSTALGAPVPDIESAVNQCSQSTLALRPNGIRDGDCPVLDANSTVPTAATRCSLKPWGKELAGNVSSTMLGLMGCSEGNWASITTPCVPKPTSGGPRWASVQGRIPVILVALAVFVAL